MSWYAQMMKSQELVRERNRRVERRQQGERYGPMFVAKYHLAALDKEKKMIEKELERIRKGIHKTPKLEDSVQNKANHILSVTTPRFLEQKQESYAINPEYSKEEDHLYDAIVFLQNNPSALVPILSAHAQSDAYFETLERISPMLRKDPPQKKSFLPKYLTDNVTKSEKNDLLSKYETLLHRNSPILRRNSPLTKRKNINSPVTHRDSPLLHDGTPRKQELKNEKNNIQDSTEAPEQIDAVDGNSGVCDVPDTHSSTFLTEESSKGRSATPRQSFSTPQQRRQPSIAKLSYGGMTSARENVSRRLSNNITESTSNAQQSADAPPTTNKAHQYDDAPPTKKADNAPSDEESHDTADDKKQTPKALVMFPVLNPDVYLPDGSLRTMHNMPSFETRWEEAKKARYIRTKELLERDRELSVQEIFQKPSE